MAKKVTKPDYSVRRARARAFSQLAGLNARRSRFAAFSLPPRAAVRAQSLDLAMAKAHTMKDLATKFKVKDKAIKARAAGKRRRARTPRRKFNAFFSRFAARARTPPRRRRRWRCTTETSPRRRT